MTRTTIQLSDQTKRMLDSLKAKGQTYDELVAELFRSYRGIPKSMAGAYSHLPPFPPSRRRRQ